MSVLETSDVCVDDLEDLADRLKAQSVKNESDQKLFLPRKAFSRLVTRRNIEACVSQLSPELLNFACEYAPKIFAIVVSLMCDFGDAGLLGLQSTLQEFRQHHFTDTALPVGDLREEAKCQGKRKTGDFNTLHCRHDHVMDVFHTWGDSKFNNFYERQWRFLAPVFTKQDFEYYLEPGHILPFTNVRPVSGTGHFGDVRQAHLHADHHEGFSSVSSRGKAMEMSVLRGAVGARKALLHRDQGVQESRVEGTRRARRRKMRLGGRKESSPRDW